MGTKKIMNNKPVYVVVFDNSQFGVNICQRLASKNTTLRVLSNASKNVDKLDASLKEVSHDYKIIQTESQTSGEVNTQIRLVVDECKKIDAFIYLLPALGQSSISSLDEEQWSKLNLEINRLFWYYRVVSKQMAKQRSGSIIGVTFGVNARGDADMLTWTIVGEAMVGMSKCLAAELLKQDVRVNSLGYGYMEGVEYPDLGHEVMQDYSAYLGINRQGNANDVESLLALLVSKEGSYITGQTFYVNGGLLI